MKTNNLPLEINFGAEEAARLQAEAEEIGLPYDGVVLLTLTEMAIQSGKIDPSAMMSAHDHLLAMADKIEQNGVSENDAFDIVAKLRILANFTSTQLVPVDPY